MGEITGTLYYASLLCRIHYHLQCHWFNHLKMVTWVLCSPQYFGPETKPGPEVWPMNGIIKDMLENWRPDWKYRKIQEIQEVQEIAKTYRVCFKLVPAGAIVSCIPSPEEALGRSLWK